MPETAGTGFPDTSAFFVLKPGFGLKLFDWINPREAPCRNLIFSGTCLKR